MGHDREMLSSSGGRDGAVLACAGPVPGAMRALASASENSFTSNEMFPAVSLDLGPVSRCKSGLSSMPP